MKSRTRRKKMKKSIRRKTLQKTIRRKNVQKSIRHSQRGGGKKFEFSFQITTSISKNIVPQTWNNMGGFDGSYIYYHSNVYLGITVKKPREKSMFRKQREEYLFDVNCYIPGYEGRPNKDNLTRDELVLLFFETYESDKIFEVSFMKELISELESHASRDSDNPYLKGLSSLVVGLREELDRRTHPPPPPPAEHFTSKKDTRAFTPKKDTRAFTSMKDTRDWLSETGKTWPIQMVPPPKYQ